MMLMLNLAGASSSEVRQLVEALESAGIEPAGPVPGQLEIPGWHDVSVALGNAGLITSFYHVIQTYLNRAAGQRLSIKTDDGIEISFRGGSPRKVEALVRALASTEVKDQRHYESKTRKRPVAKPTAGKQKAKKHLSRPKRKK